MDDLRAGGAVSTPPLRLVIIGTQPAISSPGGDFFAILRAARRPRRRSAGRNVPGEGRGEPQFLPFIKRLSYKTTIPAKARLPVRAMRHIAAAVLLLMSLGLEAQGPPSGVPGQSASARSGGIDAILGSATRSGEDFLPADQAFRLAAL